jgi:hypothetical protein
MISSSTHLASSLALCNHLSRNSQCGLFKCEASHSSLLLIGKNTLKEKKRPEAICPVYLLSINSCHLSLATVFYCLDLSHHVFQTLPQGLCTCPPFLRYHTQQLLLFDLDSALNVTSSKKPFLFSFLT